MAILHISTGYKNTYPESIMARAEGMRSPNHADIDYSIYGDNLSFPPGLFAGTTGTANKFRFLPRTKWVSVNASVATVSKWTACLFVPGDVLTVIDVTASPATAGAAVGTVASVDVTGDCNLITFTAAPTAPAGGAGSVIGIATSRPVDNNKNKFGLISPNNPIEFNQAPDSDFGCFIGATVHRSLIPHIDDELEKLFPLIELISP